MAVKEFRNFYRVSGIAGVCLLYFAQLFFAPVWYDEGCHYAALRAFSTDGPFTFVIDSALRTVDNASLLATVGLAVNAPCALFCSVLERYDIFSARVFIFLFGLTLLYFTNRISDIFKQASFLSVLLFGLSIQFLTYGAQYLGEIPALTYLAAGAFFLFQGIKKRSIYNVFAAAFFFNLSILSKEYIAAPLGLALLFSFFYALKRKSSSSLYFLFVGALLPLGAMIYYSHSFAHLNAFRDFWTLKSNYQSEFWNGLNFNAVYFILGKPLIFIGFISLLYRFYLNRSEILFFLLIFHCLLIFFFLTSAGYDRFGLWLLWIPALFAGKILLQIYHWMINFISVQYKPIFSTIYVSLCLLIFTQRTFPIAIARLSEPRNLAEKKVIDKIINARAPSIFTYELTLLPFLIKNNIKYRIEKLPPACKKVAPPLTLRSDEIFIASDYALTEFNAQWKKKDFFLNDSVIHYNIKYYFYSIRNKKKL